MLIKIILIYLLIGALLDLIGRIMLRNTTSTNNVKTFGDVCLYVLSYILVIVVWPVIFIEGIVAGIKCHD